MKLAMLTRLALLALLVTFIVTPETFAPVFAPFTPFAYEGPVLFVSDESPTGYHGVTHVASAPDMAVPYLASFQSASSPEPTLRPESFLRNLSKLRRPAATSAPPSDQVVA